MNPKEIHDKIMSADDFRPVGSAKLNPTAREMADKLTLKIAKVVWWHRALPQADTTDKEVTDGALYLYHNDPFFNRQVKELVSAVLRELNLEELLRDRERYYELLFQVARKFPNETRHETALRYIKEMESKCLDLTASEAIASQRKEGPL